MKTKYLSHAQASAMHRDYQHLLGAAFGAGHRIDLICVAPYSRILQWQFVNDKLCGKPQALSHTSNPTGRYDVIVVSKTGDDSFLIKDLRSYLQESDISYDAARYACLRTANIPPVTLRDILG